MQADLVEQQEKRLTIGLLTSFEVLTPYTQALEALAQEAIEPNPYFEPWCLFPALEHLEEGTKARFLMAHDGDLLVGFLPLIEDKGYSHLPVKYLRTFMHRHCFVGTPLLRPGYEHTFFAQLSRNIAEISPANTFLQLQNIIEGGPVDDALRASLPQEQFYSPFRWERAALASNFTYEQYLHSNIRSKKRKELRRLNNRLAEEGVVSCHQLRDKEDVACWCQSFMAMEHDGWRGHGGSSLIAESTPPAYLESLVQGALLADKLLFLRLDLDQTPIAMLINFQHGRQAWSFKIAFNSDYSRYSPGVMIEQELMRMALDDGILDKIDSCASQNHPMINKLWAEREQLCYWNIALPGHRNRMTYYLCRNLEKLSAATRKALNTDGVSA